MNVLASALLIAAASLATAPSQDRAAPTRPHITGLAHVALYVHDIEKSRAYYGAFLGYQEVLTVKNDDGSLRMTFFKINDRQYIELFPETEPGSDRLAHLAIETDDVEALRLYLKSRGVSVPESVTRGRLGNLAVTVKDPDGHTLEFMQYGPASQMVKLKGAALGPDRISTTMRHAGLLVGTLEPALTFYRDVLGFRETWRGSRDGKVLDWVNLQVPDGEDYVEFMLYRDLPPPTARGNQHHICLFVDDIAASASALQQRAARTGYARAMEVKTGINRKRNLNLYDPDGTRSELMEPRTIDGKPTPSSAAPPPR